MTKTFKQLQEEFHGSVENYADPNVVRNIRTFARQITHSFQATVPYTLRKIENELNKFGLTLGLDKSEMDDSADFPVDGGEDFLIYAYSSGTVIRNIYLSLDWSKLGSGRTFDYTPEGSKLMYSVELDVIDTTSDEMDSILADLDREDSLQEATYSYVELPNKDVSGKANVKIMKEKLPTAVKFEKIHIPGSGYVVYARDKDGRTLGHIRKELGKDHATLAINNLKLESVVETMNADALELGDNFDYNLLNRKHPDFQKTE